MADPPMPAQPDHLRLRVSDAERRRVAEVLSVAAGDGRLTVEEYDQRLHDVWAATTRADLVPLVRDLVPVQMWQHDPAAGAPTGDLIAPVKGGIDTGTLEPQRAIAVMSGFDLRGTWPVPGRIDAFALMGGGDIDLRRAIFTTSQVTITATAIMGGIAVTVPPHVSVQSGGMGVMGGCSRIHHLADSPDAPLVVVRGFAVMGGVEVTVEEAEDE